MITPIHPGEILKEEFLEPLGLSANKFAAVIDVPANRISEIVKGSRAITAATALRLAAAFDTSPEFWLNLQDHYDLEKAKRDPIPAIECLIFSKVKVECTTPRKSKGGAMKVRRMSGKFTVTKKPAGKSKPKPAGKVPRRGLAKIAAKRKKEQRESA